MKVFWLEVNFSEAAAVFVQRQPAMPQHTNYVNWSLGAVMRARMKPANTSTWSRLLPEKMVKMRSEGPLNLTFEWRSLSEMFLANEVKDVFLFSRLFSRLSFHVLVKGLAHCCGLSGHILWFDEMWGTFTPNGAKNKLTASIFGK